MILPVTLDEFVMDKCDFCRTRVWKHSLDRHPSGHYACLDCQEHPEWHGYGGEGDYEAWLAERGLTVDDWKTGWRKPAA